ncbi:MAG: hypothetical protein KGJ59_13400 [Bacteroidota bacterium]|nr:hypothetical protein [Bacteroidota bacterium]
MTKRFYAIACAVLVLCGKAMPQFIINGQASAAFVKSNDGESQYDFNEGRGSFVWRWDVFADAEISDNITFLSNIRLLQDQIPHIDLFALRITDVASTGINVQAGQIDLPFGNLGEQRFPKQNPFYQLPLIHEHITSLCRSDYKVWTYTPEYAASGDGVRLLDQGLYDLGVKVYGSVGMFDYGVALINGMTSTTGTYSPGGLNPNHGFGKVARLAVTPFTGLTVGVSYAFGPFMKDESDYIAIVGGRPDTSAFYGIAPDNYLQHIVGGDMNFSAGHLSFLGEAIYNSWDYIHSVKLKAFGYSAMIRYAFTPRFSAALRAGGITFNKISGISEYVAATNDWYTDPVGPSGKRIAFSDKWDHDVFRLEGATGIRLDESLLLKIGYQWNRTLGLSKDPADNVLFVQTVLSF